MVTDPVIDQAQAWLARDPDPDTREELSRLLGTGALDALHDRFAGRLAFGTAGIRGAMGAGPARMNRLVVRQVSAGLAARLAEDGPPSGRIVVVGNDARHRSRAFARDAAAVLAVAGFDVRLFEEVVPTPLVAFATRYLDAAAGVQITASHNPPRDNGYKVYWRGGAQIVAPLDAEIAVAIDRAADVGDLSEAPTPQPVPAAVTTAYHDAVAALSRGGGRRDLPIVYTPLHGVAGATVTALLERTGFGAVHVVDEQMAPDPDFPTVDFPNPEVAGAMDRAEALAATVGAELVLANDPDGDRIAVGIGVADERAAGGRRVDLLSGDEVGCLLAEVLLRDGPGAPEAQALPPMVATTVVSSQLLGRIAEAHGARFDETLTGFKWLARAVDDATAAGYRPVVAYEQALGVMLDDIVRDKDGISAAVVVADLAARLAAEGRTLRDELDGLARRHGLHLTTGRSLRTDGTEGDLAGRIVDRLRSDPPQHVAGVEVVRVDDYVDLRRRHRDGRVEPIDLPTYPLVGVALADGSRLQVRPSGTEPLLKFYVEVVEPVTDADPDVAVVRQRAQRRLDALADTFVATVT